MWIRSPTHKGFTSKEVGFPKTQEVHLTFHVLHWTEVLQSISHVSWNLNLHSCNFKTLRIPINLLVWILVSIADLNTTTPSLTNGCAPNNFIAKKAQFTYFNS
jgi:hypothetical protein